MANDDKISGEKLQYDINRETNKISALSAVTIDKYVLQVKTHYFLIKKEWLNKLTLHILL